MADTMRFAIMGSGAVGGYFGGRLAEAGLDVAFIARGAHLAAMQASGLHIEGPDGDTRILKVTATDVPASLGQADVVIVAVKTWQLADAIEQVRPLVGPTTVLLPLLNGVEASDQLAAAFGNGRVLNGLCRIISLVERPGVIKHVGAVPTIVFGERDGTKSGRVAALAAALEGAGIAVEVPDDVDVAVWTKLLFVVALGGVAAVARSSIGEVRSLSATRTVLRRAMEEIRQVARGRGVRLPDDIVATALAFIDTLPPDGAPSLQRDIVAGRPSELEAWTGAVVRIGREVGVSTPVNDVIYGSLLPQERRARGGA